MRGLDRALTHAGGGALCIYHRGRKVVDVWAGTKDTASGTPWTGDTMGVAWSTSKGVVSTALHLLADRGLVDYDAPVADHWPEFAVNGKEQLTVRHVLTEEAGLHDIRHLVTDARTMLDWDAMVEALAAAAPAYEPGTQNSYHAWTYGWLVGELVRRISGRSVGAFVRSELAEPLDLDGFFIGTPAAQHHRVATYPTTQRPPAGTRAVVKAANAATRRLPGAVDLEYTAAAFAPEGVADLGRTEFLEAEIPAANGTYTARSLARLYAALVAPSGLDGVRLWSPETLSRVALEQNDRRDLVLGVRPCWQLGYHPPFPRRVMSPRAFGFFGVYGSGAWGDPDRQLAVALVCRNARLVTPLLRIGRRAVAAADRRT